MQLDIHMGIQAALVVLGLAVVLMIWRGIASIRSARQLPFFRMRRDRITGAYAGGSPQRLGVRLTPNTTGAKAHVIIDGRPAASTPDNGLVFITLPAADPRQPCAFQISQTRGE